MILRRFSVLRFVAQPTYALKSTMPVIKAGGVKGIIKKVIKACYGRSIAIKPFNGTGLYICYEKAQHLLFAFSRQATYEPLIQGKAAPHVKPGVTVFDIGGNIGQYALFFSKLLGDKGRVITVEPDHRNFSFLHFNVHANNLRNVTCLKKGVGDENGYLEFYRDTETGGRKGTFAQRFADEEATKHIEKVDVITMDSLIEKYGEPGFVKIDVEGFEDAILRGLTRPLPHTVFMVEVRGETKQAVFSYFAARGFTCSYIDLKEDVIINHSSEIPDFANLLFTKTPVAANDK